MEKEKEVVEKFPWTALIIGLVIEFCFIAFFMAWNWLYPGFSPYNRGTDSVDPLYDVGVFLGLLILSLPLMGWIGKKMNPRTAAVLIAFFFAAWPMAYYGVWLTDMTLLAKAYPDYVNLVPSYWFVPVGEATKLLVGGALNISYWITPLLYWSTQVLCVTLSFVFLGLIWRKRLLDIERLPFPTTIPIYETVNLGKAESKMTIFKEKMLWAGFGLAWLLYVSDILRVASRGAIPRLPLYQCAWFDSTIHLNITTVTKTALIGTFNLPIFFGCFFLPLDILFSLWVTQFFFYGLLPAVGIAIGVFPDVSPEGPSPIRWGIRDFWFVELDSILSGVIMGIGIWFLWAGRDYLRDVFRAIRGKKELDEPILSHKWSLLLFIICQVILILSFLAAGSNPAMTIAWWPYMLIVFLGFMRIRAEFWFGGWGPWYHRNAHWWSYQFIYAGTNKTQESFVTNALLPNWMRAPEAPLASDYGRVLDTLKVNKEVGGNDKWSAYAFLLACVIGILFAIVIRLAIGSSGFGVPHGGFGTGTEYETYTIPHLVYLGGPEEPFQRPVNFVFGVILACVLMFLKATYVWWPLNPIGMAGATGGWAMPITFFSVFGSWIFKYVTLRVGGSPLHRRMMLLCAGFMGGYFIKEIISFLVGMSVGLANIPPAA